MFQKPSPEIALQYAETGTANDTVETVVGPSMNVEGDFVSEGNIIIKGFVSGSIKTKRTVNIEAGARVVADVKAAEAVISGQVKGNIRVAERLEITASAQIAGDIQCQTLMVEAGALIQGKISMAGIQIEVPKTEKKRSGFRSTNDEEDKSEV